MAFVVRAHNDNVSSIFLFWASMVTFLTDFMVPPADGVVKAVVATPGSEEGDLDATVG